MIIWFSIITIFSISFFLALKSAKDELSCPPEVRKIKIRKKRKKRGLSGVILFLKKKIVHYSS